MLNEKINCWMEEHREEFLKDLADLIAIPSVAKEQDDEDAPYGEECARVLEFMLKLGRQYGFQTENIKNRIGRIIYSPETEQDIGVWGHLDVVEAGKGWQQEDPYKMRQEGDWILGRGVRDDKGPTLAVLYAMRYMKENHIPCSRGLSLYMGCSEERGLQDVVWYVEHGFRCPGWSLIVDSAWPMTRGEKGMLSVDLYAGTGFSGQIWDVWGGPTDNAVPADAWVVLPKGCDIQPGEPLCAEECQEGVKVSAKGRACHSAFPQGGINAIGILSSKMGDAAGISESDRKLWKEICDFSSSNDGSVAGIQASDPLAGNLTCVATTLRLTKDRRPRLHLNIRYPAITDGETVKKGLENWCETCGWHMEVVRELDAYMLPLDHPMVMTLMETYNDIMDTDAKPLILAGGTYAGRLPNAVGYGMGGRVEPGLEKIVPPGHGHPHGPDECGKVSSLLLGASIYAEALTRLANLS